MTEGLKTALWSHQAAAVAFARDRRGAMLAMDLGTGKSLAAIALMHEWSARRVLVVSPLSVVGVWPRELAAHSALPWIVARCDRGSVRAKADEAAAVLARAEATGAPALVVVNHESVWRRPFVELALRAPWDLMVVDESHRAKAPGGKLSRCLGELGKRVPRRLALTGTPLPHSLLDAYAQFRFLDRSVYGTSYQRFKMTYAVLGGFEGRQVIGYKNVSDFESRFARIAYQVRKADALDLPETLDVERACDLEPEAQRVYRSLARHFWAEVEAGEVTAANALAKLLRLQQVTSGCVDADGVRQVISTAKRDLLRDVLADIPARDPVVVFCRFLQDLDAIAEVAYETGRAYGEISGRCKDGLDDGARMRPDLDLVGAQIQSGGVGVDLTRAATAIYYSTGYDLGAYLQSRARVHRPGQTRPVTYVHLIADGTIDEEILAALRAREDVVTSILASARRRVQ